MTAIEPRHSIACCDFQLLAADKTSICGRSMEFPTVMESQLNVHNREEKRVSTAPNGGPGSGLEWTSKYGYVNFNAFDIDDAVEGLNEVGLSFGFLTLMCAEYQKVDPSEAKQALAIIDVGSWILGNFATVEEVTNALKNVKIWGGTTSVGPLASLKLHIALHDKTGKNLVIEFTKGKVRVYDNPIGVLTNDPPLPQQHLNLGRYNFIKTTLPEKIQINGVEIPNISFRSSMSGLPGDWASDSRFVRVAKSVEYVAKQDGPLAMNSAWHILNNVDIPKGMAIFPIEEKEFFETTRYDVVKDLSLCILQYRSYNDLTIRGIDLKDINFTKGTPHKSIAVQGTSQFVVDMTDKF